MSGINGGAERDTFTQAVWPQNSEPIHPNLLPCKTSNKRCKVLRTQFLGHHLKTIFLSLPWLNLTFPERNPVFVNTVFAFSLDNLPHPKTSVWRNVSKRKLMAFTMFSGSAAIKHLIGLARQHHHKLKTCFFFWFLWSRWEFGGERLSAEQRAE